MNMKKICIIVLCLCLLAVPASPAFAAEPALDSFLDRYGSLLGDYTNDVIQDLVMMVHNAQ